MLGTPWGRGRLALGALALGLLAASPAHAGIDCGATTFGCQTHVDNSGRVWFLSPELLTEDALGSGDLRHGVLQSYERVGDKTTLIHGPDGEPIPYGDRHRVSEEVSGISPDGERVYIETEASLTPEDHDPAFAGDWTADGYEIHDGEFRLVTTGPLDESVRDDFNCCGGRIVWASDDGSHVYFVTDDRMTADDLDDEQDVYLRVDGTTRLVSGSPEEVQPDPNYSERAPYAEFLGASPDGNTAYFTTYGQLTADDTEKMTADIYSWHDGTLKRLTHTIRYPEGFGQPFESFSPMNFAGASEDGSIFYLAYSPQSPADTDGLANIYRTRPDGTSEILTPGGQLPTGEGRFHFPLAADAVSQDGKRLFFTTTEALLPADTDDEPDIYLLMTETGQLRLVSEGRSSERPAEAELTFSGISRDGRRAYFSTWEQLTPEDTDDVVDVYEWFEGHLRLATPSIEGHHDASFFDSISPNGRYVVFSVWENLDLDGEEHKTDIYLADMGSEAEAAAASASRSGAAARPGRRHRWHRTIRRVNVESIAPQMRIGARGTYGGDVARVRLGCPKTETSGPCHGRARLVSRDGRPLTAGGFRIAAGRRRWVALHGPGLPRRGGLDAILRVRGADALHNVAHVQATVALRHTR
jgi:hypothetical protein